MNVIDLIKSYTSTKQEFQIIENIFYGTMDFSID